MPPIRLRRVRTHRAGFTLVEMLVAISVVAILTAMTFPAVQSVRAAARRTLCMNNLRQLGLGCLNYESANGRFPDGCVLGQGAGWSAFILDDIERQDLSDQLILADSSSAPSGAGNAVNWTSAPNETICATYIDTFRCPVDPVPQHLDSGPGPKMRARVPASYLGVASGTTTNENDLYWTSGKSRQFVSAARSGVLIPTQKAGYFGNYRWKSRVGYDDILDGSSSTLLLGETVFDTSDFEGTSKGIDHWYIGSYQVDENTEMSEFLGSTAVPLNLYHRWSDAALLELSGSARATMFSEMAFGFASWHPDDGVNFVFADGSTHYLAGDIDPTVYAHLGNRQDRQPLSQF